MAPRLLRAAVLALTFAVLPATAQAAAPPQFVTTQWLVRVPAGVPSGFLARALDPDGDAVTLTWTFDDGTTAGGERVTKAWTTPGSHSATVTATDATGLTTARSLTTEVVGAPLGPQPGGVSLRRPGPSPAASARVAPASGALRLTADGSVALTLACAPGADCAGRVALAHGGRRLTDAPYAVPAGRSVTVRLRLRPSSAARLRRRTAHTVVVTLVPHGQPAERVGRVLRTA